MRRCAGIVRGTVIRAATVASVGATVSDAFSNFQSANGPLVNAVL